MKITFSTTGIFTLLVKNKVLRKKIYKIIYICEN